MREKKRKTDCNENQYVILLRDTSKVSGTLQYQLRVLVAFASLHFAKVLIASRATSFGKVCYSDNQIVFKLCCVGGCLKSLKIVFCVPTL